MTEPAESSASRNISLQVLRGIAALLVLVFHAAYFTSQKLTAPWMAEWTIRLGFLGVMVFFVLSGFLMEAAVRRYSVGMFLMHRFLRLFPTYWLVVLLAQWLHHQDNVGFAAMTLLPVGIVFRPLHVEWTLVYEVFFYLVTALLCLWKRAHLPVMVLWLAVVGVDLMAFDGWGTSFQPTWKEIALSGWCAAFACGGIAAHVARRWPALSPVVPLLAGSCLVLFGEFSGVLGRHLFDAGGIALIMLGLVTARPRSSPPGTLAQVMYAVGEWSYGLYLAHSLTLQVTLNYVSPQRASEPFAVFAGIVGIALAIGLVIGAGDSLLYRTLKRQVDAFFARRKRVAAATPEGV